MARSNQALFQTRSDTLVGALMGCAAVLVALVCEAMECSFALEWKTFASSCRSLRVIWENSSLPCFLLSSDDET